MSYQMSESDWWSLYSKLSLASDESNYLINEICTLG